MQSNQEWALADEAHSPTVLVHLGWRRPTSKRERERAPDRIKELETDNDKLALGVPRLKKQIEAGLAGQEKTTYRHVSFA